MTAGKSKKKSGNKSAKGHIHLSTARLFSVQAVYQMLENDEKAGSVVSDFMERRIVQTVESEDGMVKPDGVLFQKIVAGVEARRSDLNTILYETIMLSSKSDQPPKIEENEPLLYAVLLCGAYELLAHHETDIPVIIEDYLNVTHAFFDGGEAKLVNGVLDKVARSVRD